MVTINDIYEDFLEGGQFSSPRKNLGNKLFIYAGCRILADLLDYNLIVPENSLIRRENKKTGQYENQLFPFKSILNRKEVKNPIKVLRDDDIVDFGSIENIINTFPNHGFINESYFSKYDYIKPYKNLVKSYYKSLTLPSCNNNDIVIMLRDSNHDWKFSLPDNYYLDILKKESFDNLYVSLDHINKHQGLLTKLSKYNPILIDGLILDVFSQVTSFNKIIACQGTFSFWTCFLSNASKIYWPLTQIGPNSGVNSNDPVISKFINLQVDDEDRYEFINVIQNEK
jgi:hypothetical protein